MTTSRSRVAGPAVYFSLHNENLAESTAVDYRAKMALKYSKRMEDYELLETVGIGAFGKVKSMLCRQARKTVL